MEEGHPAGPGDAIVPESSAQTSKWRPQHRSGVRGPVPFLLALLLLAPTLPRAAAVPPTDLSILFDGTPDTVVYVNGSTVEASAILNFTGPPDPPPLLGDIAFQWRAPNGTVVATATVHPDAVQLNPESVARSSGCTCGTEGFVPSSGTGSGYPGKP